MTFYLDERQRKKRLRILKLKIYGGLAVFLILLAGLFYAVVYSQIFKIKNIIVTQNPTEDNDAQSDIKEKLIQDLKLFFANQSNLASFLGPDNIFVWKTDLIDEFKKDYPLVEQLTVNKDFLNRELTIEFQKREKFGIWCLRTRTNTDETRNNADANQNSESEILRESVSSPRGSATQCWWFDKNGVLFADAPRVEGDLIDKVDDFSGRSLKTGGRILEERFLVNLMKIFDALHKSNLNIKSLKLENQESQEIVVDSLNNTRPQIFFSLRVNPEFSLVAFQSLEKIGFNKIEYIDLRVENRVYYKLRQ